MNKPESTTVFSQVSPMFKYTLLKKINYLLGNICCTANPNWNIWWSLRTSNSKSTGGRLEERVRQPIWQYECTELDLHTSFFKGSFLLVLRLRAGKFCECLGANIYVVRFGLWYGCVCKLYTLALLISKFTSFEFILTF